MKEHCKTCLHADLWTDEGSSPKVHPGIDGWCEYRGEDIEDMENETCFEWEQDDREEE